MTSFCISCYKSLGPQDECIYKCACKATICNDCFFEWTEQQLEQKRNAKTLTVRCPNDCRDILIDDLADNLKYAESAKEIYQKLQTLIQIESLKHYAANNDEVRRCPTQDCPYFGYTFNE